MTYKSRRAKTTQNASILGSHEYLLTIHVLATWSLEAMSS